MVRTVGLSGYSDVHFTNTEVARKIVEHFRPAGACLEPFRGGDAFYQWLPQPALWCEITQGVDFFTFSEPVDWIITNPPFSCLTEVFQKAFSISQNCVFLLPISKYWSSNPRIELAQQYGGLAEVVHLGTGRSIGFDIGFPFAAMHFKKDYTGPIYESRIVVPK